MLLQTNSYVVPKEKRAEHTRLLGKFRMTMVRLGCESFEVYEQAGSNWGSGEPSGRYVQLIKFRDKKHHQAVQAAERTDTAAQHLIAEFCELINFPYQQQQGLFAVGFYNSVLPVGPSRRDVTAPMTASPETAVDSVDNPGAASSVAAPVVAAFAMSTQEMLEPVIDIPPGVALDDAEQDPDSAHDADAFDIDLDALDLPEATDDDDADHIDLGVASRNGSSKGAGDNGDVTQ